MNEKLASTICAKEVENGIKRSRANISQDEIVNIAEKILYNKSLNAKDRQTIYFALMGEWETLSFFHKTRGPKPKAGKFRALAEDVDRLKAERKEIKEHMASLGRKHQLPGLENVSRDTFNKCLKRGRDFQVKYKRFKELKEKRRRKKIQGNV